ncbi:MAG: hypothetical protein HFE04_03250 [Bacilli bacterium]|nr:hypothetical protein [Bacilli bacterium]
MSKEKRKETKKKLILAKYELYTNGALEGAFKNAITFNEWINYYGLYSIGKELGADTIKFGEGLLNAKVWTISDLEQELVNAGCEALKKDLKTNGIESSNLSLRK